MGRNQVYGGVTVYDHYSTCVANILKKPHKVGLKQLSRSVTRSSAIHVTGLDVRRAKTEYCYL